MGTLKINSTDQKTVREKLDKKLVLLENIIKTPDCHAETLLGLHTIVNNAIIRAQNILNPDEVAACQKRFAHLSAEILKLIYPLSR